MGPQLSNLGGRCASNLPKYTLDEIAKHNTEDSCWIIANGLVYDITPFLDSHPAGRTCLLRKAGGTDCTRDFKFHSGDGRKKWFLYLIGRVDTRATSAHNKKDISACTCGAHTATTTTYHGSSGRSANASALAQRHDRYGREQGAAPSSPRLPVCLCQSVTVPVSISELMGGDSEPSSPAA